MVRQTPKKHSLRIAAGIVAQLIRDELLSRRHLDKVADNLIPISPVERAKVCYELKKIAIHMEQRSRLPSEVSEWKEALQIKQQDGNQGVPSDAG